MRVPPGGAWSDLWGSSTAQPAQQTQGLLPAFIPHEEGAGPGPHQEGGDSRQAKGQAPLSQPAMAPGCGEQL